MNIHITLDKNASFNLNVDSYEYTVCGDFNRFGNGFLEVSNVYPLDEQFKYEAELYRLGMCREEKQESNLLKHPGRPFGRIYPYRFWSGKRNTKVWLCNEGIREEIDISSLSKIGGLYRVIHVDIRLNTYEFNVGGHTDYQRLDIMYIYLAEK